MTIQHKTVGLAHLSEKGQLTIPAEYRRDLALEKDSALALVRIGNALVLIPYDDELSAVTDRLEAALHGRGLHLEDVLKAAEQARADMIEEQFGRELVG